MAQTDSKRVAASNDIDQKLEKIISEYGFVRPDRKLGEYPDGTVWKTGQKPDYRLVDLLYFQGKTRNHAPGSLAQIVETLVKHWEMEIVHLSPNDYTTVDLSNYRFTVNGKPEKDGIEATSRGTYNWLFEDSVSADLYDASKHTYESSDRLFRGAFTGGFPWEVLEVFSGPPRVAFTWRHWGTFTGSYEERTGQGEVIELFGFTIATVNEALKIQTVEVYLKPDEFIKALRDGSATSEDDQHSGLPFIGRTSMMSRCPVMHGAKIE